MGKRQEQRFQFICTPRTRKGDELESQQETRTNRASIAMRTTTLLLLAFTLAGCGNSYGVAPITPNPAPTLTTISPTGATAGSGAFTLMVNGTNFISSSVVNWNGNPRMTAYVSATLITAAISATDVAPTGTAQVTVTNPAPGGGTSAAAAFAINPASNSTPTLVQHVSTQSNAGYEAEGPAFHIDLPQATLAGNCLVFGLTHHYSAARTVSITDNQNNTWPSPAVSVDNTTNAISTKIYAIAPATGTQHITVTFDAALLDVHFSVSEFYHCATSGTAVLTDGSASRTNASGGPVLFTGSFTTTTSGDLIWNYAVDTHGGDLGAGVNVTAWTKGSNFTKLSADRNINTYTQYQIQPTAGDINPSFTVAGATTDEFNDVAIAIKPSATGTAPSGIHIVHEFHFRLQSASPTVLDVPSTGNLIVPAFSINSIAGGNSVTSITDGTNTYTKEQPSASVGQIFHADNAATNTELTMTVNSASPGFNTEVLVYDISGAAASPFDKSAMAMNLSQPATNVNLNDAPDITPSTANGLVIAVLQMGIGPPSGMALPGYTFTAIWSSGMTDASPFNFGEGHAIVFNSNTNPLTFNWKISNGPTATTCNALAVAFKAAP